jgi:hypothetical protein
VAVILAWEIFLAAGAFALAPLALIPAAVFFVKRLRIERGNPFIVVGQVKRGAEGAEVNGLEGPDAADMVYKLFDKGHYTTFILDARAAATIDRDGLLRSAPERRGALELGLHRRVNRSLIVGEHAVFLCTPAGKALYQLSQFRA